MHKCTDDSSEQEKLSKNKKKTSELMATKLLSKTSLES